MKKINPLFIVLPAALAAAGFLIYLEVRPDGLENSSKLDDNVFDIEVKGDTVPANQAEAYKEKWREKDRQERKIENTDGDDFFAAEVKKKPFEMDSIFDDVAESSRKKEVGVDEPIQHKPAEKPKTVIVYVKESPVKDGAEKNKDTETASQIVNDKPRRKVGFSSTTGNGSVGGEQSVIPSEQAAGDLEVVIQSDVLVRSGTLVPLRVTSPGSVNGGAVAPNTVINALATVNQSAVTMRVLSLQTTNGIVKVDLSVYSLNGFEGIALEGNQADQQIVKDVYAEALTESARKLNVPIIRSLPKAAKTKTEDVSINLYKGHKLVLKKKV